VAKAAEVTAVSSKIAVSGSVMEDTSSRAASGQMAIAPRTLMARRQKERRKHGRLVSGECSGEPNRCPVKFHSRDSEAGA